MALQHLSEDLWDVIFKQMAQDLMRINLILFKLDSFDGTPINEIVTVVTFFNKLSHEGVGSH